MRRWRKRHEFSSKRIASGREKEAQMSKLADALRAKFKSPKAAIAALGLDESLLESGLDLDTSILEAGGGNMGMTKAAAQAAVRALKRRGIIAMDASEEEAASMLQREANVEGDVHASIRDIEPNAGVPPWLEEHRDDADDAFETEEERKIDEDAMRRAADLRRALGHEASDVEWLRSEEEMEFKPDTSNTMDAIRAKRASDARRKLGRDETEEEKKERETSEEAQDRKRASDRARAAMDYRSARDRHHRAMDALSRHADDWRRASDARKRAMDARKRADDAHTKAMDAKDTGSASKAATDVKEADDALRRASDAMQRHSDDARSAYDEVCGARDARRTARDKRRASDKKRAMDNPPPFKGMPEPGGEMVSKSAMDAAIEDALRKNDLKHNAVQAAIEAVRPKVGAIAMDAAIQTEADVYGKALDILGVAHKDITQVAALKQMFQLASTVVRGDDRSRGLALDVAPNKDAGKSGEEFATWLPGAAGIGRM